jgi:copper transport protein
VVTWPPATDAIMWPRVLAVMRAVHAVTVHETVTSNTAAPAPAVTTNTLSGPEFLTEEPYSTAGITSVTVLGRDAGITEIGIAMVDQGYYFRIKFGSDYRIKGEVITAPEHLLTRTFDYP